MVWKDGSHFKIKLMPADKKSKIECIKKTNVQARLEFLQSQGWFIKVAKPKNLKGI
jgi:hypothetical protein